MLQSLASTVVTSRYGDADSITVKYKEEVSSVVTVARCRRVTAVWSPYQQTARMNRTLVSLRKVLLASTAAEGAPSRGLWK